VRQQPVARLLAEAGDVERRPQREGALRPHRVQAREVAADPFQHLAVVQLRRPPAAARLMLKEKPA
jgi:hypothetical protein